MFKKHNKKHRVSITQAGLSRRDFLRVSGFTLAATALPLPFNNRISNVWQQPSRNGLLRRQASGTLRVAWPAPVTLDPAKASADSEIAFLNAVYDYLIDTNDKAEIMPRLAESWTVSEDGLEYTLKLVEGATFHDGSPFSSADVVYTFNRLKDPNISSAVDLFTVVDEIVAVDPTTVAFRLNKTNPDFLYSLSDNRTLILKDGTEDPTSDFNGTGAFKLVEYRQEDRATFEANPSYWLVGAPGVANLEFIFFSDEDARVNALRDESVEILPRMANETFLALQSEGSYKTYDIATNGYDAARLRFDRGVGTDPRVWQAFKLATDRAEIFDKVTLGFGAEGKDTPIGPLYGMYFDPDLSVPARDPQAARDLLTAAGYPDGLDLPFYFPTAPNRQQLAEILRSQWQDVGIRVELNPREEAVYYADGPDSWLEADLGITPWGSRPTPQFYLDVALKTGAVWNEAKFSDVELDALIDLAGSSLDQEERIEAYRRIQAVLIERGPLVIPYFFASLTATSESVEGITPHPFPGRMDLRFATVG
ncbi:MAG: ABC transporter substrate-binding protein [Anaerolineae bacterium]|nr:ABC transporter substrate-binding protein [Anaerolineae bacterium]